MLASDSTHPNDQFEPVRPPGRPAADWQPAGVDRALTVLDRVARYCVFSCSPGTARCLAERCEAWNLERNAAAYLAGRWLDAQD